MGGELKVIVLEWHLPRTTQPQGAERSQKGATPVALHTDLFTLQAPEALFTSL